MIKVLLLIFIAINLGASFTILQDDKITKESKLLVIVVEFLIITKILISI